MYHELYRCILVFLLLTTRFLLVGQNITMVHPDFGAVTIDNFHPLSFLADSNAGALVLEDIGKTELEGYARGWRVKYSRYRRILLRNKNGFDIAKVAINFSPYQNDTGKLATLWAMTDNPENGKVVQTHVEREDMFLETKPEGSSKETFTFPNIKPGSIIEYFYSVYSGNIYTLFPWNFQGKYPCLKSEYSVTSPSVFNFAISKQGFLPIDSRRDSIISTLQAGPYSVKTPVFTMTWSLRDIPPYAEEPYVNSMDNYISGLRFQLSEMMDISTRRRENIMKTWESLNQDLYRNSAFGGVMTTSKHWERRELRAIVPDGVGNLEKARAIFAFVRDHFDAEGRDFVADADLTLKDIYKARRGSVAEINLMLTALLREEGLAADAVILSTKDNGLLNPSYPMMENFNYVIVRVPIDGKDYLLDATDPRIGFGKLPLDCYNGYARIIKTANTTGGPFELSPDSLREFRYTSIMLSDNEAADSVTGRCTTVEEYHRSEEIRELVVKKGEGPFFEEVRKSYPFEVVLSDKRIDSLLNYDQPVTVQYTLTFPTGGVDHFYFNPMLSKVIKGNPFTAANRQYPINMPYTRNDLYVLQMDIPKGYEVEEMPKPIKVRLNENDGWYQYDFLVDSQSIQLRSRLVLNRASFLPEEYQSLRDFFALIVKKQSELIVFRKKKQ
jgi:hypothetical protein